MKIANGITELIGNTPLVRLNKIKSGLSLCTTFSEAFWIRSNCSTIVIILQYKEEIDVLVTALKRLNRQ
jgi:hypothetical protein